MLLKPAAPAADGLASPSEGCDESFPGLWDLGSASPFSPMPREQSRSPGPGTAGQCGAGDHLPSTLLARPTPCRAAPSPGVPGATAGSPRGGSPPEVVERPAVAPQQSAGACEEAADRSSAAAAEPLAAEGSPRTARPEVVTLRAELESHRAARVEAEREAERLRRRVGRGEAEAAALREELDGSHRRAAVLASELEVERKRAAAVRREHGASELVKRLAEMEVEGLLSADLQERARLRRRLLHKWHPDRNLNVALATRVMQELQRMPEWREE